MSGRVLDLFKPFEAYLPEVIAPERPVPYKQKLIWTGVSLLVFLVLGQIPLYGIVSVSYTHLDVYKRQLHQRFDYFVSI